MPYNLSKNFIDVICSPFTQRAYEEKPQNEWVSLVFLENEAKSTFSSTQLMDFFRTEFINADTYECSKFYCEEDYQFRKSLFSKNIPFWILYLKTAKPISYEQFSFYLFHYLQGVEFHMPLNLKNDAQVSLEKSRQQFIDNMQYYKDNQALQQFKIKIDVYLSEVNDSEKRIFTMVTKK